MRYIIVESPKSKSIFRLDNSGLLSLQPDREMLVRNALELTDFESVIEICYNGDHRAVNVLPLSHPYNPVDIITGKANLLMRCNLENQLLNTSDIFLCQNDLYIVRFYMLGNIFYSNQRTDLSSLENTEIINKSFNLPAELTIVSKCQTCDRSSSADDPVLRICDCDVLFHINCALQKFKWNILKSGSSYSKVVFPNFFCPKCDKKYDTVFFTYMASNLKLNKVFTKQYTNQLLLIKYSIKSLEQRKLVCLLVSLKEDHTTSFKSKFKFHLAHSKIQVRGLDKDSRVYKKEGFSVSPKETSLFYFGKTTIKFQTSEQRLPETKDRRKFVTVEELNSIPVDPEFDNGEEPCSFLQIRPSPVNSFSLTPPMSPLNSRFKPTIDFPDPLKK